MVFIEERSGELGEVEEEEEEEEEEGVKKKQAMEVREEVRVGHPFSFLPPSFSSSATTTSSSSSFQHNHYLIPPLVFDAGTGGGETSARSSGEREHMFEKVVTPSDVGKLNRLVIPKQHAERYFPLDSSANEKGLLLSFEDRSGKPWGFRYSYWNSSQSYVMTKGWSRFVKEKKLDAGDVVSFDRSGSGTSSERFFIDWRRRPDVVFDASLRGLPVQYHQYRPEPWGKLFFSPMISPRVYSNHMQFNYGYYCLRPPPPIASGGREGGALPDVFESVPVAHGKAAAAGKRMRLFGVNLEQSTSGEESSRTSSSGAIATSAAASLLPLLPPPQLRLCGGDDSTAQEELQRKGKPSLSLSLDI